MEFAEKVILLLEAQEAVEKLLECVAKLESFKSVDTTDFEMLRDSLELEFEELCKGCGE